MKSLDSAKKTARKKIVKKSSDKSIRDSNLKSQKSEKKYPSSFSEQEQTKRSMLWLLVGGMMVIVVVGWVFFLRIQIASNLNKGGGFSEISGTISKIFNSIGEGMDNFSSTLSSKLESLNSESEEQSLEEAQIRELEKKAFPQFENENNKN